MKLSRRERQRKLGFGENDKESESRLAGVDTGHRGNYPTNLYGRGETPRYFFRSVAGQGGALQARLRSSGGARTRGSGPGQGRGLAATGRKSLQFESDQNQGGPGSAQVQPKGGGSQDVWGVCPSPLQYPWGPPLSALSCSRQAHPTRVTETG